MKLIKRNKLPVLGNSYQGKHKRVLCVCSAGCLRSPTAAHLLASEPFNFNTRCAGASEEYAIVPLTYALVYWAEEIVCMDSSQFKTIMDMQNELAVDTEEYMHDFAYRPIHNLEIEDDFGYRDHMLVKLMMDKFAKLFMK